MLIPPHSRLKNKLRKLMGLPTPTADTRVAVWKAHKLLYVRNPKCGNSSIIGSIEGAEIGRVPRCDISKISDDWITFSFVRNPWDRLVSTYRSKLSPDNKSPEQQALDLQRFRDAGMRLRPDMSFTDFCEVVCDTPDDRTEKHLRSQSILLMDQETPIVAHIGKVERIQDDWNALMRHAALSAPIMHLNKTVHRHYSTYFTDNRMVNLVGDRYANDIRNFNYDFESQ